MEVSVTGYYWLELDGSHWLTEGEAVDTSQAHPIPSRYLNLPYRGWKMESHQGPSFFSPSVHGLGPTIEDGSHPLASPRFYRCGFAMVCWPSAHRGLSPPLCFPDLMNSGV